MCSIYGPYIYSLHPAHFTHPFVGWAMLCCCCCLGTSSLWVGQTGLGLAILLPHPPRWNITAVPCYEDARVWFPQHSFLLPLFDPILVRPGWWGRLKGKVQRSNLPGYIGSSRPAWTVISKRCIRGWGKDLVAECPTEQPWAQGQHSSTRRRGILFHFIVFRG